MKLKRLIALIFALAPAATVFAASPPVINEQGTAGAPVLVGACSGGATELFPSSYTTTDWSLMPEGADIRCELRALPDGAASPVPTATAGFLFKSNVLIPETTLNLGATTSRFGLDCCGVAGAVSVDTWRE